MDKSFRDYGCLPTGVAQYGKNFSTIWQTDYKSEDKLHAFVNNGIGMNHQNLSDDGLVRNYGGWEAIQLLRKEHLE